MSVFDLQSFICKELQKYGFETPEQFMERLKLFHHNNSNHMLHHDNEIALLKERVGKLEQLLEETNKSFWKRIFK